MVWYGNRCEIPFHIYSSIMFSKSMRCENLNRFFRVGREFNVFDIVQVVQNAMCIGCLEYNAASFKRNQYNNSVVLFFFNETNIGSRNISTMCPTGGLFFRSETFSQ